MWIVLVRSCIILSLGERFSAQYMLLCQHPGWYYWTWRYNTVEERIWNWDSHPFSKNLTFVDKGKNLPLHSYFPLKQGLVLSSSFQFRESAMQTSEVLYWADQKVDLANGVRLRTCCTFYSLLPMSKSTLTQYLSEVIVCGVPYGVIYSNTRNCTSVLI